MKTKILIFGILTLLLFSCKKDKTPATNEVWMKNSLFDPASITITAGTTITWTNKESVTHNVISDNGTFTSGEMGDGATFSFTFPNVGTFPYTCSHHLDMKGTVIVQ